MIKTAINILLISIVIVSCKKETFQVINLNGNKITTFGHGGMGVGKLYPSNSFESILKCLSLGMDGSEIDVQMTKDSVLIAYHDEDLSTSTNLKGRVNTLTWKEIENGYYNQIPYLNYAIVSLDQLFSNIKNVNSYKFTFDCKHFITENIEEYNKTYINAVIKVIQKYHLEDNVLIESPDESILSAFKALQPAYTYFLYASDFNSGLAQALAMNLYGITISTDIISKEQIEIAHAKNLRVAIWGLYTENDNIEGIRKNPDYMQTDKVEDLLDLLE